MKITELLRHRDPPDRPQKQYAEQEQATVHQKPYLLQLPYRTMVDIHCRIPIKTLIKCRRVCKSWRSLFSHPRFTKDLFSQTPTCHLVIASGRYFLLDFNDASSPNGVAALKTTFHRSSEDIVGSCNGFLCLYKKQLNRHGFYVSNPITGESLLLPKPIKKDDPPPNSCGPSADAITHRTLAFLEATRPKSVEEIVYQSCCAFGFGFSPVSDVYRVVVFTHSRLIEASSPREFVLRSGPRKVMVLTVGSGSWRHIGDSVMCDFDHQSGIYLNGYLHWVGLPTNGSRFIYAFDVESECFQQIPLPPWTLDNNLTKCNLGVLNGCLSITVPSSFNISVWVMKDYGVKESWTKELDIRVDCGLGFGSSAQVLNFSKERQVLLLQNRLQAYIPGRTGFVGVEVDGIPSLIDTAYVFNPSFVSVKDILRGQNSKGKGYVQADAADHGNADGLSQGIVQSEAALVKQKQQERRAPKKAKTTHEAQPTQTSTSQPVHALLSNISLSSQPTQPSVSLPLTANQFIHPITGINMKTVPCKRKRAPAKK